MNILGGSTDLKDIADKVDSSYNDIVTLLTTVKATPGEAVSTIDVADLYALYNNSSTPGRAFISIAFPVSFGKGLATIDAIKKQTADWDSCKSAYDKDMAGMIDSVKSEKEEMINRIKVR